MANFDIEINTTTPSNGGRSLPRIEDQIRAWARQTNPYTGMDSPHGKQLSPQEVQNATQTFVLSLPMSFPQETEQQPSEKPEGGRNIPTEGPSAGGGGPESKTISSLLTPKEAAGEKQLLATLEAPQPSVVQGLLGPAESKGEEALGQELSAPQGSVVPSGGGPALSLGEGPSEEGVGGGGGGPPAEEPFPSAPNIITSKSALPEPSKPTEPLSPGEAGLLKTEAELIAARLDNYEDKYGAIPSTFWFAGIAHGGKYNLTFWKGYHNHPSPESLNFGYDETRIGCGTGVSLGMDCGAAFVTHPYGSQTTNVGPGTYSKTSTSGILLVDLTANNQKLISGSPETYEPPRDGSGPAICPNLNSLACVAVISSPASAGPMIGLPPNWMIIDQFTQNKLLGTMCVGKIPPLATSITITIPGTGPASVAVIVCPQALYSVPYQVNRNSGKVAVPFIPKSVSISIAPHNPAPWPAAGIPTRLGYSEPDPHKTKDKAK